MLQTRHTLKRHGSPQRFATPDIQILETAGDRANRRENFHRAACHLHSMTAYVWSLTVSGPTRAGARDRPHSDGRRWTSSGPVHRNEQQRNPRHWYIRRRARSLRGTELTEHPGLPGDVGRPEYTFWFCTTFDLDPSRFFPKQFWWLEMNGVRLPLSSSAPAVR